jgi:hypothetical protein
VEQADQCGTGLDFTEEIAATFGAETRTGDRVTCKTLAYPNTSVNTIVQ